MIRYSFHYLTNTPARTYKHLNNLFTLPLLGKETTCILRCFSALKNSRVRVHLRKHGKIVISTQ